MSVLAGDVDGAAEGQPAGRPPDASRPAHGCDAVYNRCPMTVRSWCLGRPWWSGRRGRDAACATGRAAAGGDDGAGARASADRRRRIQSTLRRDTARTPASWSSLSIEEFARGDRRKWEYPMAADAPAADRPDDAGELGGHPINYGDVPQHWCPTTAIRSTRRARPPLPRRIDRAGSVNRTDVHGRRERATTLRSGRTERRRRRPIFTMTTPYAPPSPPTSAQEQARNDERILARAGMGRHRGRPRARRDRPCLLPSVPAWPARRADQTVEGSRRAAL